MVAVFSGPALVFLAVLALGTYLRTYVRADFRSPVSLFSGAQVHSVAVCGRCWYVHGMGRTPLIRGSSWYMRMLVLYSLHCYYGCG